MALRDNFLSKPSMARLVNGAPFHVKRFVLRNQEHCGKVFCGKRIRHGTGEHTIGAWIGGAFHVKRGDVLAPS